MAQVVAPFRVQASFPKKFRPLLEEKARYKVFYGGRGGAKSWQFARALLIKGLRGAFRVLCTREIQSSLKESSKQLLSDQIKALGLSQFYRETRDEIRGPNGTLFLFKGLRDPEALKSAEGIDCVWIEEARTVSKASWQKLDPTIRKPGAEIWISFNPELETDFLYTLFVSGSPPPSSIVQHVTYKDNPWIDAEFVRQAEHLKATDYDEYLWVYEGATRVALDGAIYANELRLAKSEGRVTRVPLDKSKPIHVFCDLGRGDATAMWFVQIIGLQYRIVGYYENRGVGWDHYLTYLENQRQDRGWFYGTIWLPHDANNHTLGARRTIKEQTLDAGYRARIVPKLSIADGINAARAIFPMCWFDEETTQRGRQCLGQYHYEIADDGTPSKLPEHDWSSHGSDGFRYMGVALRDEAPKPKMQPRVRPAAPKGRHGWLGR